MTQPTTIFFLFLLILLAHPIPAQPFQNPASEEWLQENLAREKPRLILSPELEKKTVGKLKTDTDTRLAYELLKKQAADILQAKPMQRQKIGRRMLSVSREAVRRMTTLALLYRLDKEPAYLKKLEVELMAVSAFEDWNPSHFLDVGEMALAVGLSLDWAGEWLEPEVKEQAVNALIEKAFTPSFLDTSYNWWIDAHHNWNLVCHGGLSVAALAIFEQAPDMAARVLARAVEKMPLNLAFYAPEGVYPEGPSYWFYATSYLVATLSAFESALGTDFGFRQAPGVKESVLFSEITAGPSGDYFNFFDAGEFGYHQLKHFTLLAWFARQGAYTFDSEAFQELMQEVSIPRAENYRFSPLLLLNIAALEEKQKSAPKLPEAWIGRGDSPLCVLRDETRGFYLAAKGGRAADNHGNMDGGSFIFELNGVRWALDPGNQGYNELEQLLGGQLWNRAQDSPRWQLLTKNNFGHSTLTVNDSLHIADARATLHSEQLKGETPSATFNLSPLFGDKLGSAYRTFKKVKGPALEISDELRFSLKTETLSWQLITLAEVEVVGEGALLNQDGKALRLEVKSPANYEIKIIPLSPPPLDYDKDIPGLKRVEVRFRRAAFDGEEGQIVIVLRG